MTKKRTHQVIENNESENSNVNYESSEEIHEAKKRKNKEIKQNEFEKRFDKPYKSINHVNYLAFKKKQDIFKDIHSEFPKKNSERSAEFCKWKNDICDMSQRNVDIDIFKYKRKLDDLEYDN
ncbi:hypothetical protein Glove_374g34 [Diversispora epigaea]|uniref:Uncharacterized protein n=1 Tax=Diversispora epigaea TaxID=1348612 RepID=A0A397H5G7_9GLOM|nr:hypothetical protein Glove_374g34 [Diversispora epigaea]